MNYKSNQSFIWDNRMNIRNSGCFETTNIHKLERNWTEPLLFFRAVSSTTNAWFCEVFETEKETWTQLWTFVRIRIGWRVLHKFRASIRRGIMDSLLLPDVDSLLLVRTWLSPPRPAVSAPTCCSFSPTARSATCWSIAPTAARLCFIRFRVLLFFFFFFFFLSELLFVTLIRLGFGFFFLLLFFFEGNVKRDGGAGTFYEGKEQQRYRNLCDNYLTTPVLLTPGLSLGFSFPSLFCFFFFFFFFKGPRYTC